MLTSREIKRALKRLGRVIHGTSVKQQQAAKVARRASAFVEAVSVAEEMRRKRGA